MKRPIFRVPLPCETSARLDELSAKHGTTPAEVIRQGVQALVTYDQSRRVALA
jgi:predicted DNA-binding protein